MHAAVDAQGPADRDPGQDRQGLRHGRGRRRPEHHPPAEEDGRGGAASEFRDRFNIPVTDEQIKEMPFLKLAEDSPEMEYLRERRRRRWAATCRRAGASRDRCEVPPLSAFEAQLKATDEREISTTMAFVRILNTLLRDKKIGKRIVPIVPDESRTFGMEGMFRQFGIFCQVGQLYRPQDADQLMYYKEDKNGQILQEGINEAGRHVVVDRGGDLLQHQRRADDPVLHLLLDVRLPARRRPRLGGRRHARARLPDRRHLRAAPRSTARACSTRTATATSSRRPSRTASPTTRPSPTRSR